MMTPPEVAFFIFIGIALLLMGRWVWLSLPRIKTVEELRSNKADPPSSGVQQEAINSNISVGKTADGRIILHVGRSPLSRPVTVVTFNTVAARFIVSEFTSSITEIEKAESDLKVKE